MITAGLKVDRMRFFVFVLLCIALPISLQVFLPVSTGVVGIIWRFLTCALIAICVSKGLSEDTLLNPYYLFLLAPISLLLYSEKVSVYYLLPLENKTWLIAIMNMYVFVLSMMIGQNSHYSDKYIETEFRREDKYCTLNSTIIMFALGLFPTIYQLIVGHSLFGSQFFYMMTFIGFVLGYRCNHRKLAIILLLVSKLLQMAIYFNKSIILQTTLVLIVSMEVTSKDKATKRKVVIIAGIVTVFTIVIGFVLKPYLATGGLLSNFLSDYSTTDVLNRMGNRVQWSYNPLFLSPYFYLTTPWCNLQYTMSNLTEHTYGLWLIKPFLGWIQLSEGIKAYSALVPYRFAYNTFGFVTVQYVDFGLMGSCISSVILGLFVGKQYKKIKVCNTSLNIANYALVSCAVFEMFFSNHFLMTSYPFTIAFVSWIFKTIATQRKR